MHPHLEVIALARNRLNKNGCKALATLLRCFATELRYLDLNSNQLDDEGIDVLVPVLSKCTRLKTLYINNCPTITAKGWQHLATILEAPDSNLATLSIQHRHAVTAALINNSKLLNLRLNVNQITEKGGCEAISTLLCDTSSVNSTYLSNHTLQSVSGFNNSVRPLLELNERDGKKEVAMIKVLQHHNDFVMMPLFEWEFKVLPLMINWFERASSITMPEGFEPNAGPRKLSAIYQFVRGMPLLYVETQLRRELEVIKLNEFSLEEEQNQMRKKQLEMERKQLQLRHQQLVLDVELQQFEQRKQSVKEHKESLLEKLAR